MNEDNPARDNEAESPKEFACEQVENKPPKYGAGPKPAKAYPEDEIEIRMRQMLGYVAREFVKLEFAKRMEVVIGVLGILGLFVYCGFTILMYCANNKSAGAAASAAQTAKETLVITNRPWMSLRVEADKIVVKAGGVTQIAVHYVSENVGYSVAKRAFFFAKIVTNDKETRKECELSNVSRENRERQQFGDFVFPKQHLEDVFTAVGPTNPNGDTALRLISCVVYESTVDSDLHYTRIGYNIAPTDGRPLAVFPDQPGTFDIKLQGGSGYTDAK